MRTPRSSILTNIIWGVGGLALGGCVTALLVRGWESDWVEATGTWFGAVATVLTLLWAVRSFRADQNAREDARDAASKKEAEQQRARAERELIEARNVSIDLLGGAGYGGEHDDAQLTSVRVVIRNHSKYDAVVTECVLDEALDPTTPLPSSLRIPAGESVDEVINIVDTPANWGEAGGGRLDRFTIAMSYRVNGQDWKRANGGPPRRS